MCWLKSTWLLCFRRVEFIHSLAEGHNLRAAHPCALINCSKAPLFGDILNTFFTEVGMCGKVTFINTLSSGAWIHVVTFLKYHANYVWEEARIRISLGGFWGWIRNLWHYLIYCRPENSWLTVFWAEVEIAIRSGMKSFLVTWPSISDAMLGLSSFFKQLSERTL